MEEFERLQGLIAAQGKLLNHIKAIVQRIKELAALLEKSPEKQMMCMGSSCCRDLDHTNSQQP